MGFARERSAKHQESNHFRLGYMGHITRVSNTIVEFAKRNAQLEGYMESNADWMKFIGDDLKLENEQLNTQLGGHRPTQLGDDDGDEFPLFALDNIGGGNNADDLLGDAFDENEEVDHDSDSDSDEEEAVNMDETENKKETDYELPQDAFSRLTQSIDDIADETNEQTMIELNMKSNEDKPQNTEDLDKWLNADDDDDDWSGFDKADEDANNKLETEQEDKVKINESMNETNKVDDFDNWDHDPFADQDLFETEENVSNENKENATEKAKEELLDDSQLNGYNKKNDANKIEIDEN